MITITQLQDEYESRLIKSCKPLIVFLVNDSPGLRYGVGTYLDSIIRVFGKEKDFDFIEVLLKVSIESPHPIFELDGNIPRYIFPSNYSDDVDYYRSVCFYLICRIGQNRRIIAHCNYACQLPLAQYLKEYTSARVVYTQHYMDWCLRYGPDYIESAPLIAQDTNAIRKFNMEKDIMSLADTVIVSTDRAYRTISSIYGTSRSKIKVVPLSITSMPDVRPTTTLRDKYNLKNERILLFVGRLDENKCIGDLIRAFSELKDSDIRLWIAGDGDYSSYMSMIDEQNWHKTTFWGFRDRNILSEFYCIAEIGLVPSIYEEFGYVALEMMAHGLPVIARNTSGLIEIMENGERGDLFDLKSRPKEIADKISNRLRNPFSENQREGLREYTSRRYSFDIFRNAYRQIFESLT